LHLAINASLLRQIGKTSQFLIGPACARLSGYI